MVVGVKCPACKTAHGALSPGDYRCQCTAEFRVNPGVTVYTGSDEPFTRFEISKLGKRTDPGFFGRGAYTTTDSDKAGRWGTYVMATVIPPDAKFIRVTSIDELYDKWGMRVLTREEQEHANTLRDARGMPTVESQAAYKETIDTWTDKMIAAGYDGVEWTLSSGKDTEYVLFHPEDYVFTLVKGEVNPSVSRGGETFSGYNQPKRTPGHPTKSHAVLAKSGSQVKLIRFGQQGVQGAGSSPKTASEKARRRSFKARHAANIARGRMSAAYWADKVKWNPGG